MSESGCNQKGNNLCNLEYLLVNLGRNQATAERLILLFLDNAPVLCRRLEEAAMQGDLPAMKDTLHDIRSSCVLFSGHQCVDQARDIEYAVREQLAKVSVEKTAVDWRLMIVPLCECMQSMAGELKAYLAETRS
jgi:hypothetical protein